MISTTPTRTTVEFPEVPVRVVTPADGIHLGVGPLMMAMVDVARPQGTYFANVDVGTDAAAFARELPFKAGVVAIPTSVFSTDAERLKPYLRFAFCKRLPVIDEAARRLHALES